MSHSYIFSRPAEVETTATEHQHLLELLRIHAFAIDKLGDGANDIPFVGLQNDVGDVTVYCESGEVVEISIDRPRYQEAYRQLALALMTEFKMVMYSDNGTTLRATPACAAYLSEGFVEQFQDVDLTVASTIQIP